MKWFDDLSLRAKLLLNFAISGGILIAAVLFCFVQIRLIDGDVRNLTEDSVPSLRLAGEISQLRLRYRVRSLEYMMAAPEEQAKMARSLQDLDASLHGAFERYQPLATGADEKATLAEAVAAADRYRELVQQAIALLQAGKGDEAQALRRTAWVKTADHLRDQTDKLAKLSVAGATAMSDAAHRATRRATVGGIVALVAGAVLAFLAGALIARRIAARLHQAVAIAGRIAGGDLQGETARAGADEIGRLFDSMGRMQQSLRAAIASIRGQAATVATASHDLASASSSVKQSTDIQSESAAAIAANVEQLTVSINHVADVTRQGARLAAESDGQARQGREATEQLVAQMGRVARFIGGTAQQIATLEAESDKITRIVGVIKDIAEQTNLLALNAAIEAARAGEQGRGFAVVADEVRTLSERTAVSTLEISQTVAAIQQAIRAVVGQVEEAVALSDEGVAKATVTGQAIAQMQAITQQVAQIVEDIDTSLREQSAASTEVAQKVERISVQAEETSNASSRTSSAAGRLDGIAQEMQRVVAGFSV